METDHKKILCEINSKFNPIRGKLDHTIESDKPNVVKRIRIEIETDEFIYTDPFYGKIKANKFLHEFVNIEFEQIETRIKSIHNIQELVINPKSKQIPGWFSNSLDVEVREVKFGVINTNNEIKCTIKYFLTKSDSYPFLSGEREEHMKFANQIDVTLSINNLLFLDKRKLKIKPLKSFIDGSVYQLESKKNKKLVTCEEWHEYIEVELKRNTIA